MLISCECLNFNASSPQLQRSFSNTPSAGVGGGNGNNNNNNSSSSSNNAAGAGDVSLPALLSQMFVQKYPKNFVYYSNFMDFFKNAHGPIPDLTVNAINQRDLIYSLTLDVAPTPPQHQHQSWQLYICINCKLVLCAKRLIAGAGATPPTHYLYNSQLIRSEEDLKARRSHKNYSESYGLLIMDNDDTGATSTRSNPAAASFTIGSLQTTSNQGPLDNRVQRLRQLQAFQQARVQAEINETNERIERYTEQKYALLKSFREKCEQEGALLTRLIQQLPEQAIELLDRAMPVALEVTTARRRNTISSRRELTTVMPTTPTTPLIQPPSFMEQLPASQAVAPPNVAASIITSRKMSNFDTPPATPEATPMSVGNSPTFRQQQQQSVANNTLLLSTTATAAAGGGGGAGTDDADDCLFDLEDVDGPTNPAIHIYQQQQQQHQQQQQQYQRQQSQQQQQLQPDNMSDADEAEDALDLDSSLPIPMRGGATIGRGQFYANFARSLPVEIANSPLAERAERANNNNNNNHHHHQQHHHHHQQQHHVVLEDEEVMDNTVDIAASIKALAKSVHGEPVFGDLPRPRLRSQI